MSEDYKQNPIEQPASPSALDLLEIPEIAEPEPEKPILRVDVTRDGMEASIHLQKPFGPVLPLEDQDLRAALAKQGVVYGVDEQVLQQLRQVPVYDTPVTIAKGTPAKNGENGSLEYLIRLEKELRPQIREDGTADHKNLGIVQNVAEGQVLCRVHPPQPGEDGRTVYGDTVSARAGVVARPPTGKNTTLNDEGTAVIATCAGDAQFRGGAISVETVLRISEHVDSSTGNIVFSGDVIIGGDVREGFLVQANNITVRGTVEGATLHAANDISISLGMTGGGNGKLIAGGNIKCPYIQTAGVGAGGNVHADSILHCMLDVRGDLILGGRRGRLLGGTTRVGKELHAKDIGNDSATASTEIIMQGIYDHNSPDLVEIRTEIEHLQHERGKMAQVLAKYPSISMRLSLGAEVNKKLQLVEKTQLQLAQRIESLEQRLASLINEKELAGLVHCRILCKETIYRGTRISFGPFNYTVQMPHDRSRVFLSEGEILVRPL